MSDDATLLSELLAVRGVRAAALVGVDGEFLSGDSSDKLLLDRMVGTVTSALAAGEALGSLLEDSADVDLDAGASSEDGGAEPDTGALNSDAVSEPEATDDLVEDDVPQASGLRPRAAGEESRQPQLMVMYQDGGPILFTPLPGGTKLAVVALSSSHDIGRARFQLRALTTA